MGQRLSWEKIKELYDQQYVELVSYDWPEEEIHPRSGIVRAHSSDRAEFYRQVGKDSPIDSAIVFVGKVSLPKDVIFSPGLRRVALNHA
jgi:hypothetical protein